MEILEEIEHERNNSLVVTLPSTESWEEYEKEISKVKNFTNVMNFKVHSFPKGIKSGDRCYVVHKGVIKGWMEIVGFSEKEFTCNTTNRKWKGKFIERSGPFHYLMDKIPMKGFQGFRYFNIEEYKNKLINTVDNE